jgi:hypothetical protein
MLRTSNPPNIAAGAAAIARPRLLALPAGAGAASDGAGDDSAGPVGEVAPGVAAGAPPAASGTPPTGPAPLSAVVWLGDEPGAAGVAAAGVAAAPVIDAVDDPTVNVIVPEN